jgi:hypothetical protein
VQLNRFRFWADFDLKLTWFGDCRNSTVQRVDSGCVHSAFSILRPFKSIAPVLCNSPWIRFFFSFSLLRVP